MENATGVDTRNFTKMDDLASLQSDVHKLDIDELRKYYLV